MVNYYYEKRYINAMAAFTRKHGVLELAIWHKNNDESFFYDFDYYVQQIICGFETNCMFSLESKIDNKLVRSMSIEKLNTNFLDKAAECVEQGVNWFRYQSHFMSQNLKEITADKDYVTFELTLEDSCLKYTLNFTLKIEKSDKIRFRLNLNSVQKQAKSTINYPEQFKNINAVESVFEGLFTKFVKQVPQHVLT